MMQISFIIFIIFIYSFYYPFLNNKKRKQNIINQPITHREYIGGNRSHIP